MRKTIYLASLLLALCSNVLADTHINTEAMRLSFDSSGQLQSAIACFPVCSSDNTRVQQFGDNGIVRFQAPGSVSWRKSQDRTDEYYELQFDNGSGASITWRIPLEGYRLELELSGIDSMEVRSGESFRPREAAGFGTWLEQSRYAVVNSGKVRQAGFDDTDISSHEVDQWAGYRNRYWTLVAAPPRPSVAKLHTAEDNQDARLSFEALAAGNWSFYLGPIEPDALKAADPTLSKLIYAGLWFWLRWICFGMFYLLAWLQAVIPSWGLAVMAMSLVVNILMLPLSRIADRFQQQVHEIEARLAPELNRIKKNFKGEEQAAKILALYKTERVHPLYSLKSMMGVAVVIPVFIGAFDMLAENIHLLNTGFLWAADLSRPDDLFRLPFRLPFFGAEFNLLPFLMTGLSVVASSLHNPQALDAEMRKKQVRNMLLLAVAFFALFYTFPAGMVLYWTTNNLISVIKSLWARR
jgi:YidC/Oxa1 family membrane protein insertase